MRPAGIRLAAAFLAALLALALALASRAEAYIYWADNGDIGRANLDGTGIDHSFITDAYAWRGVAVDESHIYWANSLRASLPDATADTIGRADLDGTSVDNRFITAASEVQDVAADDEHIYWTNADTDRIGRANLDGTGVDQSFITGAYGPLWMAVDGGHIYWANAETNWIARANLDGSGVDQNFITGANLPLGVAVDDAHVYWANNLGPLSIGRASLDGTGVDQNFITATWTPAGVAVDGAHVYWTQTFSADGLTGTGRIGRRDSSGVDRCFITGMSLFLADVAVDGLGPEPSEPGGPHACEGDLGPSNQFRFVDVKRQKRKGTAKLIVEVPGPGELDLAKTKRMKADEETLEAAGKKKLSVVARRKARKRLNRKGRAKVNSEVTYTPDGGEANTRVKRVRLIKRR